MTFLSPTRQVKWVGTSLSAILLGIALCTAVFAQQAPPSMAPTTSVDASSVSSNSEGSTSDSTRLGSRSSLTAGQIGAILQQKPEVVIEIKKVAGSGTASAARH